MVIRTLKMMVSLVTSGPVILPSVAQEAASNKIEGNPNILLIMVDDFGLGDLSCQYAKDVQTPNIDRLFHQGVRMDNFYANSSVSSPSRAGLLTGCFPDMVGVPGVIQKKKKKKGELGLSFSGCYTPSRNDEKSRLSNCNYR